VNLHGIVGNAVGAVNPQVTVSYQESVGYVTDPSGRQVPSYKQPLPAFAQVQALSYMDLKQLEGVNMNGDRRAMYLYGHVEGVIRPKAKGGDLITDERGNVWLVVQNLEQWPNWCKVAVTLQNGS
jgi:hypothetical protein